MRCERRHVRRAPGVVHRQDRARARGDRRLHAPPGRGCASTGSMSANTGVAPACTMTFAVAQNVSGVVMTSSPGPTPRGEQREVQRRRARIDGDGVRRADVVGERLLELGARAVRWSASRTRASRRPRRSRPGRSTGARTGQTGATSGVRGRQCEARMQCTVPSARRRVVQREYLLCRCPAAEAMRPSCFL